MFDVGYNKPLFILPFDHRSSFVKNLYGIENREPSENEVELVRDAKRMIYEAFQSAVEQTIPKDNAAILVDEQFGSWILSDAKSRGYTTILPVEKSGQDEFAFEYGDQFPSHVTKFQPTFVKALIRYNAEGDHELNIRQGRTLKQLSDFCHKNGYKFLIEPLIPPNKTQLEFFKGDTKRFDTELRPTLTVLMIEELHKEGVEPDVWKIEGFDTEEHYKRVVERAKINGRQNVSLVVLGRAGTSAQVDSWILAGAKTNGVTGFAVGRTVFWNPLVAYRDKKISRSVATSQITQAYLRYYNLFTEEKK